MPIAAFLIASLVALAVPGPDVALVIRTTITRGRTHGFATAGGIGLGLLVHALLALVGLSALIYASETAYGVVRVLGAAYLVFLGVLAFRDAAARTDPATLVEGEPVEPHTRFGPVVSVRRGLLTNLLNPKVILFFVAFLPQFAGTGAGAPLRLFLLGLAQSAIAVTYFCLITLGVHAARRAFESRRTRRIIDAVAGVVFCAFGVALVWSLVR